MTNHAIFAQAYLIAFIFWTGITVGSLAILMVQYLSGGAWGLVRAAGARGVGADLAAPHPLLHADRDAPRRALSVGAA